MAASDDIPLTFLNIYENSFYFGTLESDFQEDGFRSSSQHPRQCWIQSMDRKFLVLKTSKDFEFQDRNSEERQQSDCKFKIQVYLDSGSHVTQPIMLYTDKSKDQVMAVCCSNNREVVCKSMDIGSLKDIRQPGHEALFYWRKISCDRYTFESTLYKGHYLAFEPNTDYSCMHKLILRSSDEVDESRNIIVTQQKA